MTIGPFLLFCSLNAAPTDSVLPARPGAAVERALAPQEQHRYALRLPADSAFEAAVLQIGVDVVVEVLDEDGRTAASIDGPNSSAGSETVFLVSPRAASWTLVVRPYTPEGNGRYRIDVVSVRTATPDDHERAAARLELARAWSSRGALRYADARRESEAALERVRRVLPPDAPERVEACDLLGYVYDEIGLFDRGAEMFRESLAIRRRSASVPEAVVLENENNLAWLELGGGHYGDAAERFASVVARRDVLRRAGTLPPNGSLTGLGQALARLGRREEARAALGRAIAEYEAAGEEFAGPLSELGRLSLDEGRLDDAEADCRRAMGMRSKSAWSDLGRASDLRCLAAVDIAKKRFQDAREKLDRALALCEQRMGPDSLCAASARHDIARVAAARGDAGAAREALRHALRIRAMILPASHPEVVELQRELAAPE
jgi:tetratricopeptide (TPR) repeat protein